MALALGVVMTFSIRSAAVVEVFSSIVGSSSAGCWDKLCIDDVRSLEGKACTIAAMMLGMSSAVSGWGVEFGGILPGLVGGRVRARIAADV